MSKFKTPSSFVNAAPSRDAAPPADDVKFTMTLAGDVAGRVDTLLKAKGGVPRVTWIRGLVLAALEQEGA